MTLYDPLWMQDPEYSGLEDRALIAAVGDNGVVGVGDLAVTPRAAGANMTVEVAPGACIIAGPAGSYLCRSDAVETVGPLDAAPSVGSSRIDVVYARVRDAQAMGGSANDWIIGVATGTAASSPTVPAIPSYAIELARITVLSSTASITSGRIANARTVSASPSDRWWPIIRSVYLEEETCGTTAETWGSVEIPPVNRPVEIVVTCDAQFACAGAPGDNNNMFGNMAVRVEHGDGPTVVSAEGVTGLSETSLHAVPVARSWRFEVTPGRGEPMTVAARIRTLVAGQVTFSTGHLLATVYPL